LISFSSAVLTSLLISYFSLFKDFDIDISISFLHAAASYLLGAFKKLLHLLL